MLFTVKDFQKISVTPKSNKWLKIVLLGVTGLVVASGLVFAGYWWGRESANLKTQISKPQLKTQNLTQTQTQTPSPFETPFEFLPTPTLSTKVINYNQIEGWESYENISGGYSIQYDPKAYQVEDKDETNPKFAVIDSLKLVCIIKPPLKTCQSQILIQTFSDYNGGSRRQWLDIPAHSSYKILYYEDTMVGNIKALIAMSDHFTYIAIPFANKMILITMDTAFYNPEEQRQVGMEEVYRFLSGFRFLN